MQCELFHFDVPNVYRGTIEPNVNKIRRNTENFAECLDSCTLKYAKNCISDFFKEVLLGIYDKKLLLH